MNIVYELHVSANTLRMPVTNVVILTFILLAGILFTVYKMLLPVLATRPVQWTAIIPSAVIIFTLLFLGFFISQKFLHPKAIKITLLKEGVMFDGSHQIVPLEVIHLRQGKLEGAFISDGSAASIPLGDALVFKIDGFNKYFDVGFFKSMSPQYLEAGQVRFPIGDKGISKAEVTRFIEEFERLKGDR